MIGPPQGRGLHDIATFNANLILSHLRHDRQASRTELREATGLSAQAITDICERLINQGYVRETGKSIKGMGRPRRSIALEPSAHYAVGVHIDPGSVALVLLDFAGTEVTRHTTKLDVDQDPALVIRLIASTIDEVLHQAHVPRDKVLGIGAAVPGPLDSARGMMVSPPHLPRWDQVPIAATLGERTALPVLLEKDVAAAALGESWAGRAAGWSDFLFLYLGTGLGLGLVSAGRMLSGQSANVGDIGHLQVGHSGPECTQGHIGCLGILCSPQQIIDDAVRTGAIPPSPAQNDLVGALNRLPELAEACLRGESRAIAVVETAGRYLGRAVTTLASLADPSLIVLGGPAWDALSFIYLPILQSVVSEEFAMKSVHPVTVQSTDLGSGVAAIGAASAVLQQSPLHL